MSEAILCQMQNFLYLKPVVRTNTHAQLRIAIQEPAGHTLAPSTAHTQFAERASAIVLARMILQILNE